MQYLGELELLLGELDEDGLLSPSQFFKTDRTKMTGTPISKPTIMVANISMYVLGVCIFLGVRVELRRAAFYNLDMNESEFPHNVQVVAPPPLESKNPAKEPPDGGCLPTACCALLSYDDCGYLVTENVILNLDKIIAIQKFWRPNSECYQVVSQGNLISCLTVEEFSEVQKAMLQMARKTRQVVAPPQLRGQNDAKEPLNGGCRDSSCCAFLSFFNEDSELVDEWKVAPKMLKTESGLSTLLTRILQFPSLHNTFVRVRSSDLDGICNGKTYFCRRNGKRIKLD